MKRLTVIITTRNEEANIENALRPLLDYQDTIEILVIDNASTDKTKSIANRLGVKVIDKGPERCAQRNYGVKKASSQWVLILDADMIVPKETISTIFDAVIALCAFR